MNTTPHDLDSVIESNEGLPRYFRIDANAAEQPKHDLMKNALRDVQAKALLQKLTPIGNSLYYSLDNESRFVRHDRIVSHWRATKNGTYSVSDDGIVHLPREPPSGVVKQLIVIFSPINSRLQLSRYFRPSVGTLMKYVPPNTLILRIADLGVVKSAVCLTCTTRRVFLPLTRISAGDRLA